MKTKCIGGPLDDKEVEFAGKVYSFTTSTEKQTFNYQYCKSSNVFVCMEMLTKCPQ